MGRARAERIGMEGAWPSGQRVGRNPMVRGSSPALPLAGFVLGSPEFKSSATLVNSQLVASYQLGFLNCYVASDLFVSKHLSGVPVS